VLDDLDAVVVLERRGQPLADVAAAGEISRRNGFSALRSSAITAGMLRGGDEEDLVVGLDHRVPLRLDGLALAVDRRDPRLRPAQVFIEGAQFVADQRARRSRRARRDQPHPATREVEHLQRAGMLDQPRM
jgi:hypothetical protein